MLEQRMEQIENDGLTIVPGVYSSAETDVMCDELTAALQTAADSIRSSQGVIYAARNVLQWFPQVKSLWQRQPLLELLRAVLGPSFGLVRVLFFDKPPERSWALPWHRDRTMAVRDNQTPSEHFSKPTFKAGVPHIEAPHWLLQRMLTLRIHLDQVTTDNGPLQVIPGSHLADTPTDAPTDSPNIRQVLAGRGDVLAIRPLVLHGSIGATPGSAQHRRTLHLEFSGQRELPDNYEWRDFVDAGE